MRPYVDYYKQNNISPVAQDISDLDAHFARRRHLARLLGVVPAVIEGGAVLEFGPGTGHNALWTLAQRPARYDLVDANPVGLVQARAMLHPRCPPETAMNFVEALIEDVSPEPVFDLVLAEGLLPLQTAPARLLRHMASFVKPGGVLVVTTMDGVSVLAEMLRRLYSMVAVSPDLALEAQATALAGLWRSHLATLSGMTRRHEDWVLDNVLQPFRGQLFSFADVVETLAADFDFLGSAPHFVTEWRWHKDLCRADCGANQRAVAAYLANLHNVLDCRHTTAPRAPQSNETLSRLATAIFDDTVAMTTAATPEDTAAPLAKLRQLAVQIDAVEPQTTQAIADFLAVVDRHGFTLTTGTDFGHFTGWFGRGQQYVSLTRR